MKESTRESGIALVLTLALLALLVLLVLAISALSRVDSQLATTATYQVQARQNAVLGLNVALGELQRTARSDDRLTGMAGVTGVLSGGNHPSRHWCGVWNNAGSLIAWLTSGGENGTIPSLIGTDSIALVATKSLNTDVTEREHTRAIIRPIQTVGRDGVPISNGDYAYWVGDEGVKLSITIPDNEAVVVGKKHAIDQQLAGVSPDNPALLKVISYEQVSLVGASAVQRQGGFHNHTRTHYGWAGPILKAGLLNVNSTSARYWKSVGASYNERLRNADARQLVLDTAGTGGKLFGDQMAAAVMAAGPFKTVTDFLNNGGVQNAITDNGADLLDFKLSMQGWFATRSDTFRIRAYGDSLNPVPATGKLVGDVEAAAYCEAIVQRIKDNPSSSEGRFIITYFRWLGPDDI